VVGIALATVYSANGWIGSLLEPWGLKVAYTPVGIVVAMIIISLPFVVRTLQPVIEDIETETEEAAVCLGASRWQTFRHVLLPSLFPSILTGFALAFARSVGEYGSVIFIAGNMPMVSEITSLLIITKLEQFNYSGATAIASVMLAASFVLLLTINLLQRWSRRYANS
jgi:sulfate transport system permease protein